MVDGRIVKSSEIGATTRWTVPDLRRRLAVVEGIRSYCQVLFHHKSEEEPVGNDQKLCELEPSDDAKPMCLHLGVMPNRCVCI
jgi:hypothetical protein